MDLATFSQLKNCNFFNCQACDYKCCKNSEWARHIATAKHKQKQNATILATKMPENSLFCETCNKEYKDRTGLWRHKKKCAEKKQDDKKIAPEFKASENSDK